MDVHHHINAAVFNDEVTVLVALGGIGTHEVFAGM